MSAEDSVRIIESALAVIIAWATRRDIYEETMRRARCDLPRGHAGVLSRLNKCPETNPWRNRLVNARLFGPAVFPQARAERSPREGLLNALALLLWEPLRLDFERTRYLQSELRTTELSQAGLLNSYQALWKRLN